MNRRFLLLALPVLALIPVLAKAQEDTLADAFSTLSPAERQAAQEQLTMGGFYDGPVDGAYGPRTRAALVSAAIFIKDNSYGRASFDLTASGSARQYVGELARGDLAKHLWGEGDECDEC